jgi:hypothetical protein
MIKYQQYIDDLVSWYVNGVLSNTLFSSNNMLSLIIGNLVTNYLCPYLGKQDYRIKCELILEERLGNSLLFIIPHV